MESAALYHSDSSWQLTGDSQELSPWTTQRSHNSPENTGQLLRCMVVSGEYYHCGLAYGLESYLFYVCWRSICSHSSILTAFHCLSLRSVFCPPLCWLKDVNMEPFVVGLYCGKTTTKFGRISPGVRGWRAHSFVMQCHVERIASYSRCTLWFVTHWLALFSRM